MAKRHIKPGTKGWTPESLEKEFAALKTKGKKSKVKGKGKVS